MWWLIALVAICVALALFLDDGTTFDGQGRD